MRVTGIYRRMEMDIELVKREEIEEAMMAGFLEKA
jgi:hypothetical protein